MEILHTDMAGVETGLQLNVRTGFCWFNLEVNGSRMLRAWIMSLETELEYTFLHKQSETDSMSLDLVPGSPLNGQHVQDRLYFARTHVRWTIRDWTSVLFTDESRFCLDFTDKRQLVWRMSKEQFHYLNMAEHDHYGKGSVMVWTGISVNGKTDLMLKTER